MSRFVTLESYRAMLAGRMQDGASGTVSSLYRVAAENGILNEGDALLIGDLQALSGYTGLGDERLTLHALLVLMFSALGDGSLCLALNESGLREQAQALGLDGDAVARGILKDRAKWTALIGAPGEFKPLILSEDGQRLYFQRWFDCERRLEVQLKRLLQSQPDDFPTDPKLKQILDAVLEKNPARSSGAPLKLDDLQRAALGVALLNDFSILSGGPGTGKTTLIAALLRCLVGLGISAEDIRLAAPTGRAAARMTESIRQMAGSITDADANDRALLNLEAQTLHRLLVYRPSRNDFQFNAANPLVGRLLVVDEISMVDAAMMARLLEAVPKGMRVILVGDREQLPSVEAGAVLNDLLPENFAEGVTPAMALRLEALTGARLPHVLKASAVHNHAIVLRAHRRAVKPLQPIVAAVRQGLSEPLFQPDSEAYHWLDLTSLGRDGWRMALQDWRKRHWDAAFISALRDARTRLDFEDADVMQSTAIRTSLGALFERLRKAQILTAARAGLYGCERINDILSDALQSELDPRGPRSYFSGLPILVTRNNYTQRLFNGDIGLVLADRDGRYRAIFPQATAEAGAGTQNGFTAIAIDALAGGWEAAFAMTVHKSQGSEYDEVLLVVPPLKEADPNDRTPRMQRLLSREILYTGVTRARNAVTLCGTREAIEAALSRQIRRASGLDLGNKQDEPEVIEKVRPGFLF